ncbi:MAG: hypothetical protein KAH12_01500, partial [Anaerolineales bacterium]|nr:hypothetical protein [Anaerolineales bacterium]
DELKREPRRIYSIECMFFLRQYWERFPEQQEVVRELVNKGRLRLTSSGVTTADTLLPSAEAILRDFLIGQEWLRTNGMEQEPKLAYFTDSFGCTPALPSILRSAGFDRTAITRVDGMYFMGCDLESPGRFPRPGSSAERLLNQERSLDFIWRDRNGAQVLCHWNAFTYGQGDMLAYGGVSRVYLARLAFSLRSDRHVARRIKKYIKQLSPLSRTPYLLCPIGFDFVEPIPDLVALLDRYNQNHYPKTGVWAVNAGLDDYLALIEPYQDQLPVLELDPNPYWTGFYTARPTLKKRCRDLVSDLLLAEKLSFLPENGGAENSISAELEDSWWQAAVSNHHDFITGTSPDKVVEEEQIPWLDEAADSVKMITDRLIANLPTPDVVGAGAKSLNWSQKTGRIQINTPHYQVELSEEKGGTIGILHANNSQLPLLTGISNDLVSYRDSGGLWRMGLEFAGGVWKESKRASQGQTQIEVNEHENGLEFASRIELDGETITRRMWMSNNSPLIHFRIEGKAPEGHSVTVRFNTGIHSSKLVMDTPGGMVIRPPKRIYDPTFWPLHQFVHLQDDDNGLGLAILQPMPGAISYQADGHIELVAMRNATREKIFGLIGIPGNPASGHEHESYAFEYALLFTENGDWQDNSLPLLADKFKSPWSNPKDRILRDLADTIITIDSINVRVTAIKPASRGEGIIVRLYSPSLPKSEVKLTANYFSIMKAYLCDARERDLESLDIEEGAVRVILPGTITTIRLIYD